MKYREEAITKDKLQHYIKYSKIIEVIPIKNDEPIFILKHYSPEHDVFGTIMNGTTDNNVIIHRGKFILGEESFGYLMRHDYKDNKFQIKPMSAVYYSSDEYLNQYKTEMLPSKEFSLQSILDNSIQIKKSNISYIKDVRAFLVKFKCVESRKGKYPRENQEAKERLNFVAQTFEGTKWEKGVSLHRMAKVIFDKWLDYVAEKYHGYKAINVHCRTLETIKNDLHRYLKSKEIRTKP